METKKITLNYYNKQSNRIAFLFIISILIAVLAVLSSCQDSLGIDPNVQKNYKGIDPEEPEEPESKIFEVKHYNWYFKEVFNTFSGYNWPSYVYEYSSTIKMDTSDIQNHRIWIDLNVESIAPDMAMRNRKDRVKFFSMKHDSAETNSSYLLDGDLKSGRWMNINIKYIDENKTLTYSGKDAFTSISMVDDTTNGTITGKMMVNLSTIGTSTAGFYVEFVIQYKM